LNALTNVQPLQVAASDHEGTAILRLAGFGHEGQNTLGAFAYPISQQGTEEVRVTTLDAIADAYSLDRIDVFKIDAEGAELGVLRGATRVLSRYRPLIVMELVEAALAHQGASREALMGFLEQLGYRFWVFGPLGRPQPVSRVELDGINIVAAHKEHGDILYKLFPAQL
jgi:FkbM family methyltransferase